jgi:hypothetical protein
MRFTLLLFFIAHLFNCNGQQKKFYAAAYGGINYGKLRGTDPAVQNLQYRMARSAGFSLRYTMWRVHSLQADLSFDRKNTGFRNGGDYDLMITLNYYSARLLLGQEIYYGARSKQISFNVGTFYTQLNDASRVYTDRQNTETEMDVTMLYLKKDYGLSFGVIPKFFFANDRFAIQFEMRYDLGLKNINNNPVFNGGSVRTRYFYLMAGTGYSF